MHTPVHLDRQDRTRKGRVGYNLMIQSPGEGEQVGHCFRCALPECLQDHPDCPYTPRGHKPPPDIYHGSCFWCVHGTPIAVPPDKTPAYFRCEVYGELRAGYIAYCVYSKVTPETAKIRERWYRHEHRIVSRLRGCGSDPVCVGNRDQRQDPRTDDRETVKQGGRKEYGR